LTQHDYRPNYTFRVSINDSHVAPFLLEHALKHNGPLAIILERSAWGRSNEAALKPMLDKLPSGKAEIQWINSGDMAIEGIPDQLIKSGKSAVVMVANGIEGSVIVKAMARQEKPIPIYAHWALTGGDFWTENKAALQKVDLRFVQHPQLTQFLQRYRKRYGLEPEDPIPSLIGTVHAYDFVHLFSKAVTQAKTSDRTAIRNALESLGQHSGILRNYTPAFTKDRHDALDSSLLHLGRFDASGRIVLAH
jgi:ABC-type branched-subunit amino acid transport system substrate-binding protein